MMCSVRRTGTNSAGFFSFLFFFLSAAARGSRGAGGERARAGLRGIMSGTGRGKKKRKNKKENNVHTRKSVYTQILTSGGVDCRIGRKANGERYFPVCRQT